MLVCLGVHYYQLLFGDNANFISVASKHALDMQFAMDGYDGWTQHVA